MNVTRQLRNPCSTPAYSGWFRSTRQPWRRIVTAATLNSCWDQLLERAPKDKNTEIRVLEGDDDPNRKLKSKTMASRE